MALPVQVTESAAMVAHEWEKLNMSVPLVVYHAPCLDGFTAAWAMWLSYPDAEFVPGVYGQEPPDCTDRKVYLLDFSYKRGVMENICAQAKSVLILDHHKSAQEDLAGLDNWLDGDTVNVVFNMTKSGARLAWEWFHPTKPVPQLVQLVEDRDLWRFALPDSRAINASLFSYDYSFEQWSQFAVACESEICRLALIAEGEAIARKQQKDIVELVGKLRHLRNFKHHELNSVWCANLPYTYASEAANFMAQDVPFAATYYQDSDGMFVFSLRSREAGADVSEIAVKYGGGGHKHAAGFRVASLDAL